MFNLGKYGIKTLKSKKVLTVTYIVALTLILAVCMVGINVTKQIEDNFFKKDGQYDVIVGKTGSETGLVMGSLFYNYENQGTIPYSVVSDLKEKYPKVKSIEPMAMGDVYGNSQVIGVRVSFLEGKELEDGTLFKEDKMEVVIGYNLFKERGLSVGDEIKTSHGGEFGGSHSEKYTVVGVLKQEGTSNDNAIFTSINNIWEVHGIDSKTGINLGGHNHNQDSEEEHEHEEENSPIDLNKKRQEIYGDIVKSESKWLLSDELVIDLVDKVEDIQIKLIDVKNEVPKEITDTEEKAKWIENRIIDLETKLKDRTTELNNLVKDKTITKKVEELLPTDVEVVAVQTQIDSIKEQLLNIEAPKELEEENEFGEIVLRTLTPAEQTQWKAKKEVELNSQLGELGLKLERVKEQAKLRIRVDLEFKETEKFLEEIEEEHDHEHDEEGHEEHDHESEHDEEGHEHEYEYIGVGDSDLDERAVTAILIRSGSMQEASKIIAEYKENDKVQAVQTTHVMRKILENIDLGTKVAKLLIVVIGIQSVVILSILTGLFINGFYTDIKTFKIIGYRKRDIMGYMIVQMVTILTIASILGTIVSRVGLLIMNKYSSTVGIVIDSKELHIDELYTLIGVNLFVLLPLVIISYVLIKRK